MKKRFFLGVSVFILMIIVPLMFSDIGRKVSAVKSVSVNSETIVSSPTKTSNNKSDNKIKDEQNKTSEKKDTTSKTIDSNTTKSVDIKLYNSFKIKDTSNGNIIEVSNKDFLVFGTAAEIPSSFKKEAIKAQAVAIYTYYSRLREINRDGENIDFDFEADLSIGATYLTRERANTLWGDKFDEYYTIFNDAVSEVENQLLIYDGSIALTTFYAISSGATENSENVFFGKVPYLKAVSSSWDKLAPGYKTEVSLTSEEMAEYISSSYPSINLSDNPYEWFEVTEKTDSLLVKTISVGDSEMTGLDFRNMLDLRSPFFDIVYDRENFVITVYGYGHGVGLSQYGAKFMSEQGSDYKEILSHYYYGTELITKAP